MGLFAIMLSDVGEGVAEAELVEWHVSVGDTVSEDQVLGVVMTDKAAVEIPSSVLGKVVSLGAAVGDVVAVGAELLRLEIDGAGNVDAADAGAEAGRAGPADQATPERDAQQQGGVEEVGPVAQSQGDVTGEIARESRADVVQHRAGSRPPAAESATVSTATTSRGAGAKPLAAPSVLSFGKLAAPVLQVASRMKMLIGFWSSPSLLHGSKVTNQTQR